MKKIKKNLGQQKNGLPQQNYETDKDLVASTGASYIVKYLGYEEVKEARGVKVCSVAVAKLIKDKKNKKKMSLMISMDGVRVVDDVSRVLVLDQPIEKISFCAPDSLNTKLFSYIARDGPCRRWLCYGFYAVDTPGERLSHALGCAFTACLQRKQKSAKSKESSDGTPESKDSSGVNNSPVASSSAQPPPADTQTAAVATPPAAVAIQPSSAGKPPPNPPSTAPAANIYATQRRVSLPAVKSSSAKTMKKLPPTEITVPIPDPNRDRSSTTIGISTPPSMAVTQALVEEKRMSPPSFTADLADILLFDPSDITSGNVQEQRRRAATEYPSSNLLDEFDPLHPTFKTMQFEDDFKPPAMLSYHSNVEPSYHSNGEPNYHGNVEASSFSQFSTTNPFLNSSQKPNVTAHAIDDFDSFAAKRIGR